MSLLDVFSYVSVLISLPDHVSVVGVVNNDVGLPELMDRSTTVRGDDL